MAINYKSDVSKLQRDLERLIKKMPKVTGTSTKKALENLKSYCEEYQSEINLTILKIWTQNNKALKIANGETVTTKTLSAKKPAPKKKITDETPVKLKYKGFDIITYKGRGETWIAQADSTTDGTTFVVYSKPSERKTALEKVQEKIRNYKK